MGIGNTTAAAAIAAALFGGAGSDWVGRGTGVDDAGLGRKASVVDAAISHHGRVLADPLAALAAVGGRELAAIFGATLAARLNDPLFDGSVARRGGAPPGRTCRLAHAAAWRLREADIAGCSKGWRLSRLDLGMRCEARRLPCDQHRARRSRSRLA